MPRTRCLPSFGLLACVALGVAPLCLFGPARAQDDAIGLRAGLDADLGGMIVVGRAPAFATVDPRVALLVCFLFVAILIGSILALAAMRRRVRWLGEALARVRSSEAEVAGQSADVILRMRRAAVAVSPNILDLVGYDCEEMRTIAMAELIHPDDLESVVAAFTGLSPDRPRVRVSYRIIHRDGTEIPVEATFGRVGFGSEDFETIVTIRSRAEAVRAEGAMRDAGLATTAARHASEAAERAKSDFLNAMSHEIRTPLNAILGFADQVLATPDLSTAVRRNVERIKGGGGALLTVFGDIFDASQAGAGTLRLQPRPFSLPLLVDECVALVEQAAVAKHLALRVELVDRFPTGLMGDEARLRQILLNLLNNAIKFTADGGVSLRIGYDRAAGPDTILFQVVDTGIGIEADDLPCLFQRFRQVDGTLRRAHGGTGLGLAIAKMLVDLMEGSIGVSSVRGGGSTFWVALPLRSATLVLAPERVAPPVKMPARAPGLRILLVEDVPINQELARAILEAKGHRVDAVGDGADAIMAVQDVSYDLVLMDVQMPYVDGFTATRAIRALPGPASSVPIVAMTANVLREHVETAYAAGMNDFLPKPIAVEALIEVVDRVARATRPVETPRFIA